MSRSQTATEYLIILAVVIVIALIVVGVIGGIPGIGSGTSERQKKLTELSNEIGISSYAVYDCGTKLTLRNNNPFTIQITGAIVNNTVCSSSDLPVSLTIGESASITCVGICSNLGSRYSYLVNVSWKQVSSDGGTSFTQSGGVIQGVVGINTTGASVSGSAEIDGVCGSANGSLVGASPTSNLCSVGTASSVSQNSYMGNTIYAWTCMGSNGGATEECSATYTISPISGQCGSDNGQTLAQTPTNLCSAGSSSSVSGSGPWTWSCEGVNGGSSASCSADYLTGSENGVCGSSNGQVFSQQPTSDFCSSGTPSSITGTTLWVWTCDGVSSSAYCSAMSLVWTGELGEMNWITAQDACANLGGRLPTIEEYMLAFEDYFTHDGISPGQFGTPGQPTYYWSSTEGLDDEGQDAAAVAYAIYDGSGFSSDWYVEKVRSFPVRCVS